MQRAAMDEGMQKVMIGNNTEDDKRDFFIKTIKGLFVDYHGERLDFYKKVMDPKVFPMLMEGMYQSFRSGK
jgi:hypothetical protein